MEYFVCIIIILMSAFLFYKAAGTLKPNYINVISFVFYSMLFFELIGATIVFWGFDEHYMIAKIVNDDTVKITYYSLLYTSLIIPIIILLVNRIILNKSPKQIKKLYIDKINQKVDVVSDQHEKYVYYIIIILSIICLLSIIYVFYNIGYVSLFKLFDLDFNFNVERINISKHFSGNVYIKNIVMLLMTPILSYISYVYMKVTKKFRWKRLFFVNLIMSIFALTYNFEKSPIIYYVFFFFIIGVVLGNMTNLKKMIPYIVGCGLLTLILVRIIMGYDGNIFSISNGPVARILVSQVSSLFLHFDCFGNSVEFLNGASFPPIFDFIFDTNQYDIRSGAIVMSIYGGNFIDNGTAGVLNSLFIGEAYANFGFMGIIISPIIVATVVSLMFCWFLKSKKTPLNIVLYIELTSIFIMILQGGFVDWIYNVKIFVSIILIFSIDLFAKFLCFKKAVNTIKNSQSNKRCIYHVPNYIDPSGKSGSMVRPMKMLNAFKEAGYDVDIVMGYKSQRKNQIKQIKNNIRNGIVYDFMYSESSTMPTLLTEKNHIPVLSNIDFRFMKFCKDNNLKIGLYYRDIYWRFPEYGKNMNFIKKYFAIAMYKYDLLQYSKILDVLYLQSYDMAKYLPKKYQKINIKTLPPGCNIDEKFIDTKTEFFNNNKNKKINIFYVGGIGCLYDLVPLLKVVKKKKIVNLTICCREEEWIVEKKRYQRYLTDRVSIVHESGSELEKYYKKADLCSLYFPEEEYRKFVLPIKLFEYLSHVTPILATASTATGDFVKENDIGWAINDDRELSKIIDDVYENKKLLIEKHNNLITTLKANTWIERVNSVANDLNKVNDNV